MNINQSTMNKFILGMIGIAIIPQGLAGKGNSPRAEKLPNVLFILADDLGYGDLGCYGGKIPTPNLDKLAASGIRFSDAHSPAALCAPSRFSMLTGSYPYRSHTAGGAWNTSSVSIFSDPYKLTKAGRQITVAEVLQGAGYRTAFIGKSHLGGDIRDKNGEVVGATAFVRDITERKRVEEMLRESEG